MSTTLRQKEPTPSAELAFLIMAYHKLGYRDKAQSRCKNLRQRLNGPRWAEDYEGQTLAREAEAVVSIP